MAVKGQREQDDADDGCHGRLLSTDDLDLVRCADTQESLHGEGHQQPSGSLQCCVQRHRVYTTQHLVVIPGRLV